MATYSQQWVKQTPNKAPIFTNVKFPEQRESSLHFQKDIIGHLWQRSGTGMALDLTDTVESRSSGTAPSQLLRKIISVQEFYKPTNLGVK